MAKYHIVTFCCISLLFFGIERIKKANLSDGFDILDKIVDYLEMSL
ncbi:MAG: hypothetical protein PF638_15530 [Candidatus Delongbacteria bacterium]|nr:hypothetical protein [Candidatus Delongbacteria bacterium]